MKEYYCVECGVPLILEDDENVCEDKEFYCEDCGMIKEAKEVIKETKRLYQLK